MKKYSYCYVLIILNILFGINTSVAGDKVESLITDISGTTHHVKGNSPDTIYYEIVGSSPKKWHRIRAHNIKEVTFSNKSEKIISVSGLLKNGNTFEGIRQKHSYLIRGKGILDSDFELGIDKVKKIEFLKVEHYEPDEYKQYLQNLNWTIIDGDSQLIANTLLIHDSYLSNTEQISYNEYKVYNDFIIDKAKYYGDTNYHGFLFLNGAAEIELSPEKINYFEITGSLLNGNPEVIIKTTDGKSLTLAIGMIDKCNQHNGWDPTYGTFGSEDYYVLDDLNLGKTAISLYPLRKILFKR